MNDSENRYIWTSDNTSQLIELYKNNPCLYNTKIVDYKNKALRRQVMANIALELGTTASEVAKKIRGVRTQYAREKSRNQKKENEGCGTNAPTHQSVWAHFATLQFLDEFITTKLSRESLQWTTDYIQDDEVGSNDDYDNADFNFYYESEDCKKEIPEYVVVDNSDPSSTDRMQVVTLHGNREQQEQLCSSQQNQSQDESRGTKRKHAHEENLYTLVSKTPSPLQPTTSSRVMTQPATFRNSLTSLTAEKTAAASSRTDREDEDEIFAKYIASELRQLSDSHMKRIAKHDIQNVIFEAHCALRNSK